MLSLSVGCSEKKVHNNEVNVSKKIDNNTSDNSYYQPFYNDECVIKTRSVRIVDNNVEFSVSIKNKSNSDIEVKLDKVNLGTSVKEVEFQYKVKSNESKEGILIIKNIPKLETLNDKRQGILLINSDERYFIFKG